MARMGINKGPDRNSGHCLLRWDVEQETSQVASGDLEWGSVPESSARVAGEAWLTVNAQFRAADVRRTSAPRLLDCDAMLSAIHVALDDHRGRPSRPSRIRPHNQVEFALAGECRHPRLVRHGDVHAAIRATRIRDLKLVVPAFGADVERAIPWHDVAWSWQCRDGYKGRGPSSSLGQLRSSVFNWSILRVDAEPVKWRSRSD